MSKYTEDQILYMVGEYKAAGEAPEDQDARDEVMIRLADELDNSSIPSVRQTLVNRGVYIKKKYRTKRGTIPVTKEALVMKMEKYFHTFPGFLESLTKSNKTTLGFLMTWIIENVGDEDEIFKDVL